MSPGYVLIFMSFRLLIARALYVSIVFIFHMRMRNHVLSGIYIYMVEEWLAGISRC